MSKTQRQKPNAPPTIHSIEAAIAAEEKLPEAERDKIALRQLRHDLKVRLAEVKRLATEFEAHNNQFLLLFASNQKYHKIIGNSLLFFLCTISERISWRTTVRLDTDDYFPSKPGVVSIRNLETLEAKLATINIFPDRARSTPELRVYPLTKTYSDEAIAKFQDRIIGDQDQISHLIIPRACRPDLYDAIRAMNRIIYYKGRHAADPIAKATIIRHLVELGDNVSYHYCRFTNDGQNLATDGDDLSALRDLIFANRELRYRCGNLENLRLIHLKDLHEILDHSSFIERIALREYKKRFENRQKAEKKAQKIAKSTQKATTSAKTDDKIPKPANDQPPEDGHAQLQLF